MIPVGVDALVVIVHKDNRLLDNITQQQLRDIYTGNTVSGIGSARQRAVKPHNLDGAPPRTRYGKEWQIHALSSVLPGGG